MTAAHHDGSSLDLEQLRSLIAVVEHGSQVRAAKVLGMAPTTVGRHIKHVQAYFGARLFRPGSSSSLTPRGLVALRAARAAVASLEDARKSIASAQLRIGFIRMMRPLVERALRSTDFSAAGLDVRLFELSSERQAKALDAGQLDIAICYALSGLEQRTDLARSIVTDQPFVLVVPARVHASGELEEPALEPLDYIHLSRRLAPAAVDAGERWLAARKLVPKRTHEHELGTEIIAYAAAGLGYGFLPALWSTAAHDGVAFVAVSGFAPKVRIAAYSALRESEPVQRLRRHVADAARAALRELAP